MSVNVINLFQSFRTTLCICPCCGDIVRFSDLRIQHKGKITKTWLDKYETKERSLDKKEEKFEEEEEELREKARERGRRKVPTLVQKSMHAEFARLKYNPYDIKTILHPVDFVVFNGLNDTKMKDVVFLSKNTGNGSLNKIRNSVQSTIEKEAYDWQTAHVDIDGSIKYE